MRVSDWSSDVCASDLVILHADEGREWQTWLAAAKALELGKGAHHFMGDARLAMEAALHGNGIALGDTMTASSLMQKGSLVAPFEDRKSVVWGKGVYVSVDIGGQRDIKKKKTKKTK